MRICVHTCVHVRVCARVCVQARSFLPIFRGPCASSLPPLSFPPIFLPFLLSPLPTQPPFGDQVSGPPILETPWDTLSSLCCQEGGPQSPGGGGWFREKGAGPRYGGGGEGRWSPGLLLPHRPECPVWEWGGERVIVQRQSLGPRCA